ncbi:hypothetical protein VTL71DRAFT_389 [Oculimacula yallundae]|uniref:PLAC8 family protein n=1 Tax=Oculimacula yallundae TaxID=86028 RepID=A0ABR4CZZ8_9HELO
MVKTYIRQAHFAANSIYTQGRTTIPTHRDSVVSLELLQANSRRASLSMAQQGHVMSAYNTKLLPSTQRQPDGGSEGPVYNNWMSRFCVEPRNDVDTCCLGSWVPCALYGKTHWRTKRIDRGKDASNSTWHSNDGCNTACWAWCGLAGCLCPCVAGVLTGIQRSQIRGTYGIKGNCASDIALGICCPCCTQMQNDREIRAREGDVQMRYNPQYLKVSQDHPLVTVQPSTKQPMSYSPLQPVPDLSTGVKNQPDISEKPNKLQKKNGPVTDSTSGLHKSKIEGPMTKSELHKSKAETKSERHNSKAEAKKRPTARELEAQRQAKKKALVKSAPKIFVTQYQDEPPTVEVSGSKSSKSSEKKGGIFGKLFSNKQQTIPEETAQEPLELSSEQHTLVECDVVEVEDTNNNRKVQVTHTLVDCTTVESPPSELVKSTGPQEHMIVECTVVQEEVPGTPKSSSPMQHMIEDCERVVEEVLSDVVTVTEEHSLDACDTVPVSEDELPAQELSYVHDFTDCPVDKAILDYYEKEETKAKQTELTDRIRTSLPTELLEVNKPIGQHTLAECSDEEPTPPSSPSKHRSTSYSIHQPKKESDGPRQHRLVSCPTPTVQSHHVGENAIANGSEDSQATQRPIYNDKLRAEEIGNLTDGVSSGSGSSSGETNSGGSTEDAANPDGAVRRKQRRRHKQRKGITQFPIISSNENKPVPERSDSAHYSLEQVLAANGGKREQPQKGSQVEKSSKQKGKAIDSSAATAGGNSRDGIRSEEDPRSPGSVQNGISGLWSKLTTPTKEKTEPAWS